jgi:hypothetical protein
LVVNHPGLIVHHQRRIKINQDALTGCCPQGQKRSSNKPMGLAAEFAWSSLMSLIRQKMLSYGLINRVLWGRGYPSAPGS